MKICGGAVSLLVCVLLSSPASAVSITNRDDRAHKVTVVDGANEQSHTIAPLAVLEGVCIKPCVIRLNDSSDDEYELEGPEVVSIEEGFLYYDGADAAPGAAPAPADTPPPTTKPPETPAAPKKLP